MIELKDMVGKKIIDIFGMVQYSDEVKICTNEGNYIFYHEQDCCENVELQDFECDIVDLIGSIIISADEVNSDNTEKPKHNESYTWTFYKIETTKGEIFMRWLGESNGYYSESVDIRKENG